jgi:hypothetical protein
VKVQALVAFVRCHSARRLGTRSAGNLRFAPLAALLAALSATAAPLNAATVDSPVCRRDLADTWTNMEAALAQLKGVARAGREEKCAVYRRHIGVVTKAREVLSRCKTGHDREGDLAHMDGALDDVKATIDRECTQ